MMVNCKESGSEIEMILIKASEERHSLILMALVDLATSGAAWESTKERRDMLADGGPTSA